MSSYITAELRRKVIERSKNCCEYCLIHEDDQFFAFEIDHIIAESMVALVLKIILLMLVPIAMVSKAAI